LALLRWFPHYSGKDLQVFSEAGFDMDKIHLKVRLLSILSRIVSMRDIGVEEGLPNEQRNAPVAALYEDAIKFEGAVIADSGALINYSGKKTGRSPKDKRIVFEETSKDDIWVRATHMFFALYMCTAA
jgi:phosphoenolpyruvate carboxykinase (ATP)